MQVSKLSETLFATSHALFLVDDGTNFPNYPQINEDLLTERCEACRILIETFGDVFDFVNIQVREHIPSSASDKALAWNAGIISDATGIAVEPYDYNHPDSTFSTKVRAILFENQVIGESLSHEVLHAWASAIGQAVGLSTSGGHYGPNVLISGIVDDPLVYPEGDLLVRFDSPNETDLIPNGDGTYKVVSRPGAFNPTFHPLALYQAGFIPSSQVPAVQIVEGPDFTDFDRVTVTSVRTVTIDDVIATEGPRAPSSATAQKTFRIGTLVFGDRAYTEADYTFITLALKYFESDKQYDGNGTPPWKAATLNTSTATVALPALPASATVVTPGATPTTPAAAATPAPTATPATTPSAPSAATGTPNVAAPPPSGGRTLVQAGTSDIAALIAAQLFEVVTVWKFDFGTQGYVVFIVGAPSFANSLSVLLPTDIVELVAK